ncbi:MAG: penicillin-binding protein 1C [Xanthomonadales bacterium]|nr:penicillin-binding protein 1C [Xanthomonadales bacterium]
MTPWLRRHRKLRNTLVALALIVLLDRLFPPPIPDIADDSATLVLARDGTPLRAFANAQGVWRYPVTIEQVSPRYLEALLGYEDRWFWHHPGVNPFAFARAVAQAAWHGRIVSGGSTLTMQVARLIEPIPHSGFGKVRQMIRAVQLEIRLSKRDILTLYLNLAPFGGSIEGVQAASFAYLGKPSAQLSHSEAALLAVLPQSPSRNRPDRHPERARIARDKVLARLAEFGDWPAAVIDEARDENVVARRLRAPMLAALFAERMRREHPQQRVIASTIDAQAQRALEERIGGWISRLPDKTSAAAIVIDNVEREVLAYVGSATFADEARLGHVDMVAARRSPGSTLKPFLYALALDEGLIHSESLLVDAPQDFAGYRPANFGDDFNGPVSVAEALRLSLNVPAVDVLERVTPNAFAARLRHVGVKLDLPLGAKPNLTMALGGTATSLDELVGAYAAFGNGGLAGPVRFQRESTRDDRRIVSAGAAWVVRRMLEDHGRPGDPAGLIDTGRRTRIAWKTGTSYGFRDAWAFGVTPHYTVGVWVGRPDGTPIPGQYGAATALPLLLAVTDRLPRVHGAASFDTQPKSVSKTEICWPLGEAFDAAEPTLCHRKREAWILDGRIPPTLPARGSAASESLREVVQVNARGERILPACSESASTATTIAHWPLLAEPWLSRRERNAASAPVFAPECRDAQRQIARRLHIDGLIHGAVLRRPPGVSDPPAARLRALGAEGDVHWLLNGKLIAVSPAAEPIEHRFVESGTQRILALAGNGSYDAIEVRVLDPSPR